MKNNHLTCLMLLQFISMILFGHADIVPCYEPPLTPSQNLINKDKINTSVSILSRTCYLLEDLDTPLAINQQIRTMLTLGDEVIVGGSFLHLNDSFAIQTSGVFSYRVDAWGQDVYSSFGNTIQGTVYDLELHNGNIYAAGDFVLAGTDFYNIAYYNGTDWVGIQTGDMNGTIRDIISYDNQIYIGGDFTSVGGNNIANLAMWNGTSWSATQALQVNGPVNTFEIYEGKLVVGGEFTQVNTTPTEGLFFFNNLTVESLPTHGSMTSVDNLEVYNSVLVVGGDSLYAYRSNKWYYPNDTIQEEQSLCANSFWQIPNIGRTHEIFYAPLYNFWTGFKDMDHLMISSGNKVYGLTCDPISYPLIGDVSIDLNGPVYAMAASPLTPSYVYGGDFTSADFSPSFYSNNYCGEALATEDFFTLYKVVEGPIDLAEFTVKSDDHKTAHLSWTSLTESNSSHYEIQRKTNNENFVHVGTVATAGESLEEINYTYEDDISRVSGNYVYYRLKMVDKDGSYEYSEVRSLKLEMRDSGVSITPNPAVGVVELNMKMERGGDVNVHIYDMQGRQLCAYQWTYDEDAIVRESLDIGHLAAGLYLVEVVSPHERKTMKLDVLR